MPDDLSALLGDDDSTAPDSTAGGSAKGLRALYEKQLEENRALNARLAAQEARERSRELEGLFTKHGVPPLAKDFFPSDGELTDEAVTGFIGKYGALWGAAADAATVPADQQAAANRISQASTQASPLTVSPGGYADYEAKLGEATTRDEVMQLMNQLQAAQA